MTTGVRASVIIPCHNKAGTLPLVVDSVLRQSVQDLEVLLLGDGVTAAARAAIEAQVERDPRVRFLDFPKGPNHGEAYRHDAVMAARSDAIFYLCDDDLLLPDHIADLLALLERATFVQSLNGFIRPDGSIGSYAADLGDPASVAPILDESIRFNSVSITGTAHRRSFYLDAGQRWETTPPDTWPDHHQFRRMARHPSYVGATSRRMTALQLPTSGDGREAWTDEERVAELARWHEVVTARDGQERIDALHHRGLVADLAATRPDLVRQAARITALDTYVHELHLLRAADGETIEALRLQGEALRRQCDELAEQVHLHQAVREQHRALIVQARRRRRALEERLGAMEASTSWRLTAPLRAARRALTPPR